MAMKKRKTYYKLYGKRIVLDEIYSVESVMLGCYYRGQYGGVIPTRIQSNILENTLIFCKKRAEIKNMHASNSNDDENLLQHKLNNFDSDFRKQYQNHDDAIGLAEAAAKLNIISLYNLFFEDVVRMIDNKTPQQIEEIFPTRHNGDDERLAVMLFLVQSSIGGWAWEEIMNKRITTSSSSHDKGEEEKKKFDPKEIIKLSPADFKYLPYQQKQYWVHAHFIFKANPGAFQEKDSEPETDSEEEEEKTQSKEKEEEEEEKKKESKVPKSDDDGGSGPRGAAWKRTNKADDDEGSGSRKPLVMCGDVERPNGLLSSIQHHNSVARFLESRGMVGEVLEVATDPAYRFEFAIQFGELQI